MEVLANLVAALHIGYFVFVVGGFLAILASARRRSGWVFNPWFRIVHLCAVLFVLAEDVFRFPCPLNLLEGSLRGSPASTVNPPGAATGLFDLLLRHTIPGWFLDAMYWTLGVTLLALFYFLPPRFRKSGA